MTKMDVLVVGGGGREHALVWKIARSPMVNRIYCAPGNGGTASEENAVNVPIAVDKFEELARFATQKKIGFVVIGPDNPLADGIVDFLEEKGLKVFGPRKAGAKLESSKSHAKQVMTELGIPTARYGVFSNRETAINFARENDWARVVKEDGLALGKGVYVCDQLAEVEAALNKLYDINPSATILLEDRLQGEELSLFILCDGKQTLSFADCQDHKRRFDGDKGPNTGGMGAYSPVPLYEENRNVIEEQVVAPIRKALAENRLDYKGVLFIGILMQEGVPYVLEFNARFGDPETQAMMPRLKSDLLPALIACAEGKLDKIKLEWDKRFSCCVVACADKYPESSSKGEEISLGAMPEDAVVFQAGTAMVNDTLTTNGGRVLAVVALNEQPFLAKEAAYEALKNVSFKGMDYRNDIAWRVAEKCHSK
jgi:phosphoribosylamine--glycine ligase